MKQSAVERKAEIQKICLSENVNEAMKNWIRFRGSSKNGRAIFSFPHEENEIPSIASAKVFSNKAYLKSLFGHDHIYYLDDEIIKKYATKNNAIIRFDYSISFDTNFASYLNAYMLGKDLGINEESFLTALDHIALKDASFDYNPYVIENTQQILNNGDHKHVQETLSSVITLASIDRDHYEKTKEVRSKRTADDIKREVQEKIDFHLSSNGRSAIKQVTRLNQLIYLILLKICHVNFFDDKNKSVKSKTAELTSFMHFEIGGMFMRELIAGSHFFADQSGISIFNKIKPNSKKLLKNLRNVAWDFSMLRYLEWSTTTFTKSFHYYHPCFLSFDKDLMELFDIQASRSCFITKDKDQHFFPIHNPISALSSRLDKHLIDLYFGETGISARHQKNKIGDRQINHKIQELEDLILKDL